MSKLDYFLKNLEDSLKDNKEKSYFLTHNVRYKFIIKNVQKLSFGKKLKILDIGCFPYHIGKILEDLGHEVYGISSYHEQIKRENIKILNIDKEKLPFDNNFFDLVLFNEVLEHLVQSPMPVLNEIYRVTKKDGFFMLTTPNISRSINKFKLLFGKTIMYPIDVFFEERGRGNNIYHRHNREYTLEELKFLLKNTNWHIEKSKYFVSYSPFRKRLKPDKFLLFVVKLLNYILMLSLPSLRDTLFVIGKK